MGAKKADLEPRGSDTVAPCQAAWPCHPGKRENARQQSGTVAPCPMVRPCHFSFSHLIAILRCNWELVFLSTFSLSKTTIRVHRIEIDCCWIQDIGLKVLYAFGRLLLQIAQRTFLYLFPLRFNSKLILLSMFIFLIVIVIRMTIRG